MNSVADNQAELQDEEQSQFVLDSLARHWRAIALLAAAGAVVAFGASKLIAPHWQATALVQVGQVGNIGTPGGTLLETPAQVSERMRAPEFINRVLLAQGLRIAEVDPDPRAALIRGSLRVSVPRNTNIVQIKVEDYSRELAAATAASFVATLRHDHEQYFAPSVERLRGSLAVVVGTLATAEDERKKLVGRLEQVNGALVANAFSQTVLLTSVLNARDAEIRSMRDQRLALEEQLSPARTFPTALLQPAHVPERPVFPRSGMFALAGLAAGAVLGVLGALWRSWRAQRKPT